MVMLLENFGGVGLGQKFELGVGDDASMDSQSPAPKLGPRAACILHLHPHVLRSAPTKAKFRPFTA